MPWDSSKQAGFSKTKPWVPLSKKYKTINVLRQSQDPKSFLNLYKKLLSLRKNSPALKYGDYLPVKLKPASRFAYLRQYASDQMLSLLNFSDQPVNLETKFGMATLVCDSEMEKNGQIVDLAKFRLDPYQGLVFNL